MTIYNIYCDESGHLPNDGLKVMALGAIWCPLDSIRSVVTRIRQIKKHHGLAPLMEVKWSKVSPAKVDFYLDLVKYFFDEEALRFRVLIVPDKGKLDHAAFGQDHDTWYFKMYYSLLRNIITPDDRFRIYIDIKDTRSADKMRKLHEVLCNSIHDFDHDVIERVQTVRSHEVELLQLADLLIGAVQWANRGGGASQAKQQVAEQIRQLSGHSLDQSTSLAERKFNIFRWRPREGAGR